MNTKCLPHAGQSAIPHAEQPNQIVGVDFVQVELKHVDNSGKVVERKFNVLTCVDLATDFAQQGDCWKGFPSNVQGFSWSMDETVWCPKNHIHRSCIAYHFSWFPTLHDDAWHPAPSLWYRKSLAVGKGWSCKPRPSRHGPKSLARYRKASSWGHRDLCQHKKPAPP